MKNIDLIKIKTKKSFSLIKSQDFSFIPNSVINTTLKKEIVFNVAKSNIESKIQYRCVLQKDANIELVIRICTQNSNVKNVKITLEVFILNLCADNIAIVKPFLEISNKEVLFEHKVTIGAPHEKWIKYLNSRGIPYKEAINLLSSGFVTGH